MDRITLDREVFKALASDTRLDILKALDERQKTVTELSRELDLNKATVFEHLEKLAQVELVRKLEDERKWVYYQLSWKGRRLLHPEQITIALLLSTAVASLVTALAAFWAYSTGTMLPAGGGFGTFDAREAEGVSSPAAPPGEGGVVGPAVAHDPVLFGVAVGLGLLVLTLGVIAFLVWRQAKAKSSAAGAA